MPAAQTAPALFFLRLPQFVVPSRNHMIKFSKFQFEQCSGPFFEGIQFPCPNVAWCEACLARSSLLQVKTFAAFWPKIRHESGRAHEFTATSVP